MRKMALALAAVAAASAAVPAQAAITVTPYSFGNGGNISGTFSLTFDSVANTTTLSALNLTLGTTTFNTSNSGFDSVTGNLGGNVGGVNAMGLGSGQDDFLIQTSSGPTPYVTSIDWIIGGNGPLFVAPITVSTVPEPATWAMMLLGFAGIGFAMRRRKVAVLA